MATEEPLKGRADRLESALSAAQMIPWELDVLAERLEYTNPTDLGQLAGHPSLVTQLLEQARREAESCVVEFRFSKPDGDPLWMRYQGKVLLDENGKAIRAVGIALEMANPLDENDLLRSIAAAISVATGETFFRLLAQQMCSTLNTDYACISELDDDNPNVAHAFALFDGNKFHEETTYSLSDTPCEQALALGRGSFPQSVQALFPKDRELADMGIEGYLGVALLGSRGQRLGVMAVMSRSPINNVPSAETVLDIFAGRAAAELERRRADRAVRDTDARNRAILTALPDLVIALDKNGVIQNVYSQNPVTFGFSKTAVPGGMLDAVMAPEPAALILESTARANPNSPAIVEYSLWISGQPRFYEARTVILDDEKFLTMIRDLTDVKLAESQLAESRRFAKRVEETTPNVLFVFDLIERRNVYVNERSMDVIGYTAKEVLDMGPNFLLLTMHPDDLAMLPQAGAEYSKRKDGEVFEQTFRMRHKNGQWRWVHRSATIFSRTPDGQPKQILGACTDITEFKKTERELQELSGRLLSIQDEERRRIARELHDVTGQNLAAIGFHLGALERSEGLSAHAKNTLAECLKLCVESQKEIRTLSYLLHPPLLDPFGLVRALEWYIDGLRKRTRMEVILDVTEDIGRLPIELETDLFRVIQEGLTNSFRHAGSDLTIIRLAMKEGGGGIVLQIEDQGGPKARTKLNERGVDAGFGVGIPGMRERLRQHGGTLEISASDLGTTLTVFVPLRPGAQSRKAGENAT